MRSMRSGVGGSKRSSRATGIDGRPHAIQGALMWHYLVGQPVDELVGILNTRLAKTKGGADLDAVILDRAAAPVVRRHSAVYVVQRQATSDVRQQRIVLATLTTFR